MSSKKTFWNSDKLFGLTAMLISLVTLIIFVKQTHIMDRQSRLSAMPYLMFDKSTSSSKHTVEYSLVNYGVGPAIVTKRRIVYNGKEYDKDLYDFITQEMADLEGIEPFNWATVYEGMAIPVNSRIPMVTVGTTVEEYERFLKVTEQLLSSGGFYIEIEYQSVYGDTWSINNKQSQPQPLD